jgi:hypothetical protein
VGGEEGGGGGMSHCFHIMMISCLSLWAFESLMLPAALRETAHGCAAAHTG